MTQRAPVNGPLAAVEAAGLAVAVYLALVSFKVLHGGEVPCPRTVYIACESVVRGPFSKIGPFSIALMGVAYFVGHLALTLAAPGSRAAGWVKVAGAAAGLVFIAWLRTLELLYLKKLCPWCWGVGAATLIQAAMIYPAAVPPLPALRFGGRLAQCTLALLAAFGLTTAVEVAFKPSRKGPANWFAALAAVTVPAVPKKVPADAATPDNESTATVIIPRTTGQKSTASTASAAALSPPPAGADDPEPPVDMPEIPEIAILRARGWRMAPTGDRVVANIAARAPVLLFVYDPFCDECHATVRQALDTDEVSALPVTRVAIDQSSFHGELSAKVPSVPTLLLVKADGSVAWTHTGRLPAGELVAKVTAALKP